MAVVAVADILIITFGIPFLIAMIVLLLKWQITTKKDQELHKSKLKITDAKVDDVMEDFKQYKKISNQKKEEILDAIKELKQKE